MNRTAWQPQARAGSLARRRQGAQRRREVVAAYVRQGVTDTASIARAFDLAGVAVHPETIRRDLRALLVGTVPA